MFSRVLTQMTHIKLSLFSTQQRTHACQLPAITLPVHLLSSSARFPLYLSLPLASIVVVASLNTF
ncbi:unnamed protein product [Hymenolepis diminuta]|uniref:Uncharacterized protein n=1 Tax=Hymenolepis diminuta TaxID=6216 RepID=A0A564YKR1_HYMDI|nr:unnamed protein product [Hymenolepis diminuta]VUZ47809.1 unnamed protein product [Hymenolepis diminuta]VUZ57085.1 unnamed protein product [Hymenolepis diminuta]